MCIHVCMTTYTSSLTCLCSWAAHCGKGSGHKNNLLPPCIDNVHTSPFLSLSWIDPTFYFPSPSLSLPFPPLHSSWTWTQKIGRNLRKKAKPTGCYNAYSTTPVASLCLMPLPLLLPSAWYHYLCCFPLLDATTSVASLCLIPLPLLLPSAWYHYLCCFPLLDATTSAASLCLIPLPLLLPSAWYHYLCCFPLLDVSPFPVTSAIPKVIKAGYAHLNLKYFFTAGPDEVRAWTIMVSEVEGRSTFVPWECPLCRLLVKVVGLFVWSLHDAAASVK